MEKTFLPEHLLKPVFDNREISYKMGSGPEQRGWLALTVLGDGSVSLHLYSQSTAHGVVQSGGQILTNDMLANVAWDSDNKRLLGRF
jgi:hypothetical protein